MEKKELLCGNNQNLFNALKNVCGFTALQSDMDEIKRAVAKDCEMIPDEPQPEVTAEEMESENTADVFKRVLTELGFHDYLPSQMTNSDYWLCTTTAMKEYASLRLAEVLSKAGKELPDDDTVREMAKDVVQYDRQIALFGEKKADTVYHTAILAMMAIRNNGIKPIIASLQQSNEQKDREITELKKRIYDDSDYKKMRQYAKELQARLGIYPDAHK